MKCLRGIAVNIKVMMMATLTSPALGLQCFPSHSVGFFSLNVSLLATKF